MRSIVDSIKNEVVPIRNLIVSDASDAQAYVYVNDEINIVTEYEFDDREYVLPSTYKEMLALKMFLLKNELYLLKKKFDILYWQCDNQAACTILVKGSRKPIFQSLVFEIKKLEAKFSITLVPVWTPRVHERIETADLGSKLCFDSNQWSICPSIISNVCASLNIVPTLDAFASDKNSQCPRFFSEIPQQRCIGVDFFAQNLNGNEIYFCCPPVKLISKALNHIIDNNCKALFIVPKWTSANFWPNLFSSGNFRPQITKYLTFRASFRNINYSRQSAFHPSRHQWMMAFLVNM